MSLLVTQGNSDLSSTFKECINSMDSNLWTNTYWSVSTLRTREFTPSRWDSIIWVVVMVFTYIVDTFKNFDVILQENVSWTWTTRATGTYNVSSLLAGWVYMLDVYFLTPYTVDTGSNKWRLWIVTTTGATWNQNIYIALETNSSWNPYIIPITNTNKTFTSWTDWIMVWNWHELSISSWCVLVGSALNNQITNLAFSLLAGNNAKIVVTSTSSYNFDSKWAFMLSKTSSFKMWDSLNKITRSNQITLRLWTYNDVLTTTPYWAYYSWTTSMRWAFWDMEFYWQKYTQAKLTSDANSAQRNIVVDTIPASRSIWDILYIDTLDKQWYAGTTVNRYWWFVIDSFVDANTIRLSSNIPEKRLSGANVINASDCWIVFSKLASIWATTIVSWLPASLNTIIIDWVYNTSYRFSDRITTKYDTNHYWKTITQSLCNSVLPFMSPNGALWAVVVSKNWLKCNDNYMQYWALYWLFSYYKANFKSWNVEIKRNIISQLSGSFLNTWNLIKTNFENNYISNWNNEDWEITLNCVNWIIKNNYFYWNTWPCINLLYMNRCFISWNIYDRSDYAYLFSGGVVSSSDINPTYTNIAISIWTFAGSAAIDFVIDTPNTEVTVDTTIADAIYGSKLRILNDNNISKNDRVLWPSGNIQRTWTWLADSTKLFNYAIRFNPIFDNVEFNQLYPIGNQLWNTLSVIYKIYIPNSNYWAGEYTMPTLTVSYDWWLSSKTSVMEKVSWEWYNLYVEFTPTTELWVIDITVFGFTDQSVPNCYFYLGQCIVNKPDGAELKLSNLDLFYNALPITPTIATLTDFSENIRKIENALPIINEWVKKASILVPHSTDI